MSTQDVDGGDGNEVSSSSAPSTQRAPTSGMGGGLQDSLQDPLTASTPSGGPPVQMLTGDSDFLSKHTANSEEEAERISQNRIGKTTRNSVMNFGDSATKQAFEDNNTSSGPTTIAAKGWDFTMSKKKAPREIRSKIAKSGNFKVTVSSGVANHSDGWE